MFKKVKVSYYTNVYTEDIIQSIEKWILKKIKES